MLIYFFKDQMIITKNQCSYNSRSSNPPPRTANLLACLGTKPKTVIPGTFEVPLWVRKMCIKFLLGFILELTNFTTHVLLGRKPVFGSLKRLPLPTIYGAALLYFLQWEWHCTIHLLLSKKNHIKRTVSNYIILLSLRKVETRIHQHV